MRDQQFRQLLNYFGLSWDGYRKVRKGVRKRICRHMKELGCRTMQAYFSALDQDRDARRHCERLMTVSISRFFRDRGLWQTLENEILPTLIKENRRRVKVWSAGCACGEEVYSLKILWRTLSRRFQGLPELKIWATDMNPVYLNKARAGIYPRSSLKEVPEAFRALYFRPGAKGQTYAVAEGLKKGIEWRVHNLLFDPPETGFQLVFLRNSLLTYYEDDLKGPAFRKVVDSLHQGGFLVIGTHEKLPSGVRGLLPLPHTPYIFRNSSPQSSQTRLPAPRSPGSYNASTDGNGGQGTQRKYEAVQAS
ncbi:MAG: protein-glutamate O-methyltransferase CheR [Deltaproteobacteria bacterium]|nr:protein-glutamate O-methyltransferase CheR [Deltaproteobacteria bacterium]